MSECVFCQPSTATAVVATASTCYARLDRYPATPGHVLVVPKRHVVGLLDLTDDEAADMWQLVRLVRGRATDANIGINDGPAAGRTVDHLHVHVIPRLAGDCPDPAGGIRRGLPNGDPRGWWTR